MRFVPYPTTDYDPPPDGIDAAEPAGEMSDGANLGIGAERALKTILGGEPPETECETVEQMKARILTAPITATSYDGTATACARLILEAWKAYPQLVEVPHETVYLVGADGRMVWRDTEPHDVVIVPGLHTTLKALYADRPEALEVLCGLTGFMWGWAINAALRCIDQPSVRNPAIVEIGSK